MSEGGAHGGEAELARLPPVRQPRYQQNYKHRDVGCAREEAEGRVGRSSLPLLARPLCVGTSLPHVARACESTSHSFGTVC